MSLKIVDGSCGFDLNEHSNGRLIQGYASPQLCAVQSRFSGRPDGQTVLDTGARMAPTS